MAHDTIDHRERIVRDADRAAGQAVVKGTSIPAELILAKLAASLDIDDIFRDLPELTRDDVRAVLSYARERVLSDEATEGARRDLSPQEFYASITKRPDVSELMRRLAR
jgi:uncharacterized protein (DUF433 family)